jgi:hypothetical protein
MSFLVVLLAGDGWLNMEPFWLPRLRRKHNNRRKMSPAANTTKTMEPTTMPAIAPPESPFLDPLAVPDEDGEGVDVADGIAVKVVMNDVIVGSLTPAHLLSASEL